MEQDVTARPGLAYGLMDVRDWQVPAVVFREPARDPLAVRVQGTIINSITTSPTGKTTQRNWKVRVASSVKLARGDRPWDPTCEYAVSLALRFQWPSRNHGTQALDVENFAKPVLDAIAAGLFCPANTDPDAIGRWDYDDSNFRTLLVHRMPDTSEADAEGIALVVSCR